MLKDLGVYEDVLAKSGEPDLNMKSFLFVKGVGDHEEIYDVCIIYVYILTC